MDLKEKRGNRKRKRVQGGGYCECCGVHYSDLNVHCESKKHREFVADQGNYQELDAFCTNFREQSRKEGRGIYRFVLKKDGSSSSSSSEKKDDEEVKKRKKRRRRSILERLSGDPKRRRRRSILERLSGDPKRRRRSILERLSGDPKSRYMPNEVGAGRSRRSRLSRLRSGK